MFIKILGAAAGGGFPQWNCACTNCSLAREGKATARTQDGIAVSADGRAWFLINASPDLLVQIRRTPELEPKAGGRGTPIAGVVLTNGDLDHVLGLFSLRESQPLVLYATDAVRAGLETNALLRTLQRFPEQLTFRRLVLGEAMPLDENISLLPFAVPGKEPKHLEGHGVRSSEENVGLALTDRRTGRTLVVATAAASLTFEVDRLERADAVLFDGTFWSSDELIRLGLGSARAEDMAHLPIGGEQGSLRALSGLRTPRRIYTHINNTNPILIEGSPERREVLAAGWEVAFDGQEIEV